MGIRRVTVWVMGVIKLRTKSPVTLQVPGSQMFYATHVSLLCRRVIER